MVVWSQEVYLHSAYKIIKYKQEDRKLNIPWREVFRYGRILSSGTVYMRVSHIIRSVICYSPQIYVWPDRCTIFVKCLYKHQAGTHKGSRNWRRNKNRNKARTGPRKPCSDMNRPGPSDCMCRGYGKVEGGGQEGGWCSKAACSNTNVNDRIVLLLAWVRLQIFFIMS